MCEAAVSTIIWHFTPLTEQVASSSWVFLSCFSRMIPGFSNECVVFIGGIGACCAYMGNSM